MAAAGEHHPAFEEYCECIFELREDDLDVIQARIAERLQVSRPAVSEMIRRLGAEGLVTLEQGRVHLTATGHELAERVVRRHRLAERFLTDILGLSWADAHREAGRWEHVMSTEVEVAMDRVLGSPTTCPHGNPIPGSDYHAPDAVRLSDLGPGTDFLVSRIPEELEFAPGLLDFLEQSDILPGRQGRVTASSPDGTVTVEIAGRHVGVGALCFVEDPRHSVNIRPLTLLVPLTIALGACGSTTINLAAEPSVTVVEAATTMPTTSADKLQAMALLADSLGDQIAKGGDTAKATLADIEALWDAAGPEVRRQRAELGLEIDHQVELVRTAVERKRPADADKAAQNLAVVAANFAAS